MAVCTQKNRASGGWRRRMDWLGMKRRAAVTVCYQLPHLFSRIILFRLPSMPRIARRAAYNAAADSFSLSLVVQHDLHLPSEHDHAVHLDVVARNPLVFTLAGATNGTSATRDQLVSSKTTNYVVEYLRQVFIPLHSTVSIDVHSPCRIECDRTRPRPRF